MNNVVYLIDYENVSCNGLNGISDVKENDEIIIFYSNNISAIRDNISRAEKKQNSIKYFQLDKPGKNALDFMIAAYAGYVASKKNVSKIAIISKDKGYYSIEPIIKSINSDIELIFENCIYDVLNPSTTKKSEVNSWDSVEANLIKVFNDEKSHLYLSGVIPVVKRHFQKDNRMALIKKDIKSQFFNYNYICQKIDKVLND